MSKKSVLRNVMKITAGMILGEVIRAVVKGVKQSRKAAKELKKVVDDSPNFDGFKDDFETESEEKSGYEK